jgi:hypothetical protein
MKHYITVRSTEDLGPLSHLYDYAEFRDFGNYEIEEVEDGKDADGKWYTAYFHSAEELSEPQQEIISKFPGVFDYSFND